MGSSCSHETQLDAIFTSLAGFLRTSSGPRLGRSHRLVSPIVFAITSALERRTTPTRNSFKQCSFWIQGEGGRKRKRQQLERDLESRWSCSGVFFFFLGHGRDVLRRRQSRCISNACSLRNLRCTRSCHALLRFRSKLVRVNEIMKHKHGTRIDIARTKRPHTKTQPVNHERVKGRSKAKKVMRKTNTRRRETVQFWTAMAPSPMQPVQKYGVVSCQPLSVFRVCRFREPSL